MDHFPSDDTRTLPTPNRLNLDTFNVLNRHFDRLQLPPIPHSPSQLNVTYLNVNHLTYDKLRLLLHGMRTQGTDVLCLVDTRTWKKSDVDLYRSLSRDILGPGSSIHFALAKPHDHTLENVTRTNAIGGQVIIKSSRVARTANFTTDPSDCGAVATLHINMGATDLNIISVYCPTASNTPYETTNGSMWNKLARFLEVSHHWSHLGPTDYVLDHIADIVQRHHCARLSATICGGDFNTTWSVPNSKVGAYDCLQEWASPLSLRNPHSTLQLLPTPTFYRGHDEGVSTIDHVLFRGSPLTPLTIAVTHSPTWMVSDHRPLSFTTLVHGWDAPYISRKQRLPRAPSAKCDIKRPTNCARDADQRRLATYQSIIQHKLHLPTSNTTTAACSYIQRLTSIAVKTAKCTQKRTTKGAAGWSPETVALNLARSTILEIQRRLTGTAGRAQWITATQVRHGVSKLCDIWKGHVMDLARDKAGLAHLLSLTDHGPTHWTTLTASGLIPAVALELKHLGKLLHGRQRAEFRNALRHKDDNRTQMRQEGRHLSETRRMLDRASTYWEMDELVSPDGSLITNGKDIATTATAFFHTWHAKKPSATFGFHDPTCDHRRLLTDRNYFTLHHQHTTGIPLPLLHTIWDSLHAPLLTINTTLSQDPTLQAEIDHLSSTPTYVDFTAALKSMPTRSAAGPSGLTYNMIAALPEGHLRALYDSLVTLWESRQGAPLWKWRELSPLPKVTENITISDIRPLTLIETTRKVWVSIVVNRIKRFWIARSIIHPSQHAYTEARGVDSVHPQHRNLLEESRETCSSLFYTSWDIKRAFDRVAKPILVASWIRTGVPADVAEYLVQFDTDGLTFVGTPYTREVLKCEGLAGFSLNDTTKAPCFRAEVGTGQGDVSSPFNWNSFFDILLRALDTIKTTPLYVRSEEHLLQPTEDSGFADDLISVSAHAQGLQEKADIVSAFSIIFGLDIAVHKLRAVQVHWGNENLLADAQNTITVHDDRWENTALIPLLSHDHIHAKPIKYLGVHFDYDNTGHTQLQLTRQQVGNDFRSLHRKYCRDPNLKTEIAMAGILSRARYAAKFCSWSLDELLSVDKLFSKNYRKLLSLTSSFPTALLYASKDRAGHGLQRFSNAVNSDKYSLLHRALTSETATRVSMHGLLYRAQRRSGIHPRPGEAAPIPPIILKNASDNTLWASSLLDWLAVANLTLSTGGISFTDTAFERLDAFSARHHHHIPIPDVEELNRSGLRTLHDVMSALTPTGPPPTLLRSSPFAAIRDLPTHFDTLPLPVAPPLLLPQQSWCTYPYEHVFETLGRVHSCNPLPSDPIVLRRWTLPPPKRSAALTSLRPGMRARLKPAYQSGTILHLDSDTLSMGAGTSIHVPYADLFHTPHPIYQVILSEDSTRARRAGVQRTVLHSFLSCAPASFPHPNQRSPTCTTPLTFDLQQHRLLLLASTIYTDASYTTETHPLDTFFHTDELPIPTASTPPLPTCTGTAAIIFQPPQCNYLHPNTLVIRIVDGHTIPGVNPFLLETLALALATKLRFSIDPTLSSNPASVPIYSDCKGAVSLTQGRPKQPWKKSVSCLLRAIERNAPPACLHWIKAHPERRTADTTKWSLHEHGNHLADCFASSTPPVRPSSHLPTITVTASQVLQHLLLDEDWTVVTSDALPYLGNPLRAVQHAQWQQYLHTRDTTRQLKHSPAKWSHLSLHTAAEIHSCVSKSYTHASKSCKLIYDWYFHGTKLVQGSKDPYPTPEPCRLCGLDDSQFHMICGCMHPLIDETRSTIIRELTTTMNKHSPDSPIYKCMDAVRHLAQPECTVGAPHYIWIGTWSPPQIAFLKHALRDVPFNSHHTYDLTIKALKATCTSLATGAHALMAARHKVHTQLHRVRRRLYRFERVIHRATVVHHHPHRHPPRPPTAPSTLDLAISHLRAINTNKHSVYSTPKRTLSQTLDAFLHTGLYNADQPLNIPASVRPVHQPLHHRPLTTAPATPRRNHPPRPPPILPTNPTLPNFRFPTSPSTPTPPTPPTSTHTIHGTYRYITPADRLRYEALRRRTDTGAVITTAATMYSHSLTLHAYQRLMTTHDHGWLDDTCMTNVCELYNTSSPPHGSPSSFICLSGTFHARLCDSDHHFNYGNVQHDFPHPHRQPLNCDTIYMPVNMSRVHWTTIVVDVHLRHVTYYDPLDHDHTHSTRALYYLRQWLSAEILQQATLGLLTPSRVAFLGDPHTWTYNTSPLPSPSQSNSFDCGVFSLATILYLIQGRQPRYTQSHIPTIRIQLVLALLDNHLPNILTPLSTYDTAPMLPSHTDLLKYPRLHALPTPRYITLPPSLDTLLLLEALTPPTSRRHPPSLVTDLPCPSLIPHSCYGQDPF